MKHCFNCGRELSDVAIFCTKCGKKQDIAYEKKENDIIVENEKKIGKNDDIAFVLISCVVLLVIIGVYFLGIRYYGSIIDDIGKSKDELLKEYRAETSERNNYSQPSVSTLNVTLDELIGAYRADTHLANQKYRNKNIVVTGWVTSIAYNPNRVVFETEVPIDDFLQGGLLGSIYSLVMVLDRQSANRIEDIGRGDIITIEGKFVGLNDFNNLQMNDCKIVN